MKTKFVWLALPLALVALMLAVKWRSEHPTPTKEDLEARAFLSQSSYGEFNHYSLSRPADGGRYWAVRLSKSDLNVLIENFFLSRTAGKATLVEPGENMITIHFSNARRESMGSLDSHITIGVDEGTSMFSPVEGMASLRKFQNLHPVTVKRWMEYFLAHPRIGPELRQRMEPLKP